MPPDPWAIKFVVPVDHPLTEVRVAIAYPLKLVGGELIAYQYLRDSSQFRVWYRVLDVDHYGGQLVDMTAYRHLRQESRIVWTTDVCGWGWVKEITTPQLRAAGRPGGRIARLDVVGWAELPLGCVPSEAGRFYRRAWFLDHRESRIEGTGHCCRSPYKLVNPLSVVAGQESQPPNPNVRLRQAACCDLASRRNEWLRRNGRL